jgi:hypothetical protein
MGFSLQCSLQCCTCVEKNSANKLLSSLPNLSKKFLMMSHIFENSPSPGKSPAAADRLIMARGSEPRPKVIKIPILIEDNNNSGGQQQQQQQAGSCGNWPPGGQPEEAAAAAASRRTAGEQSGRREAAGGARTRIIPIRLSDDRLSSTDGHSPVIVASGSDGAGVGAAHGRQRPVSSDTAAAGGVSGLRARLAGSRTNSVEETSSASARPSSVKVEIGGSSARGSGTSPLPPSSSEMAETLVKASSASASDIWYVKQFERDNLTTTEFNKCSISACIQYSL